ncbi:outer membrane protein assembly factor BamB family protein [Limnoglobus roseus]|uniref:Serine/threonine protein kinase n=1 Tax=Limnoglobus roseus TaxID=2598579 RepID=A0A5C1AU35_9BACT|nr:PQQ-binding-like beta-propeller repeat protein [Limnoglobus roseus]QEL20298.1 serine/threonine protein kinase [Limnoglobus roseus]
MRKFLLLFLLTGTASAAEWSQFRGPGGACVSDEKNLPEKWSKTEGHRWKTDLPARGVSGPVVFGDKIYLTASSGVRDDRLHVLAFDLKTGKQLWHRQFAATGGTNCHPMTCMAAPTPVADETGVYALFATGDLAAFDANGTLRWYRSLVGDYPSITNQVGMASSPVLADGKLIVPMDNSGDSFIAALDPKTGTNVWKTPRFKESNWVTPVVRSPDGRTAEILFPGRDGLSAYDAATGKRLWNSKLVNGDIPTPTIREDIVYAPSGGVTTLKFEGGEPKKVWASAKMGSGMTSPLVYDGMVYAAKDGVMNTVDAKTGESLWSERFSKDKASASPIGADGKVYVFSNGGKTTVFKASREMEIVSENDLGEEILGTPAVAAGAIIIRTNKALYCVGAK